jgi:hypothetical protein
LPAMSDLGLTVVLIGVFVVLALVLRVAESRLRGAGGRRSDGRDGQGRQPTAVGSSGRKT